jgi:hypothetical protein
MRNITPEDVSKAFQTIIDFTNIITFNSSELSEILSQELQRTHRTLQQSVISSLIDLLIKYSSFNTDGRNQYSVETCKKLTEFLIKEGLIGPKSKEFNSPFI